MAFRPRWSWAATWRATQPAACPIRRSASWKTATFPGGPSTLGLLQHAGFTNLTEVSPADLATTDLSHFQELWFGPTDNGNDINYYIAAGRQIQNFLQGGGGLVVEAEAYAGNSWSWVPYASLIGASGANPAPVPDVDTVNIVDPSSPVMANLSSGDWHQTAGGLSGWNSSVHSDFTTPSAAGFTTLVTDSGGNAVDIALTFNPNVVQTQIQDQLPATGYTVDPTSISPGATSTSASGVVWNADVIGGFSASQFQLTGTVANMVPGEVRQISTGIIVTETTTTSSGPAAGRNHHAAASHGGGRAYHQLDLADADRGSEHDGRLHRGTDQFAGDRRDL